MSPHEQAAVEKDDAEMARKLFEPTQICIRPVTLVKRSCILLKRMPGTYQSILQDIPDTFNASQN
jgi:hypothetical protein